MEHSETDNMLNYFTLPNNLDDNMVIRLLQNDMATYQLQYNGDHIVNAWKEVKKEKVRKRKQKEIERRQRKWQGCTECSIESCTRHTS